MVADPSALPSATPYPFHLASFLNVSCKTANSRPHRLKGNDLPGETDTAKLKGVLTTVRAYVKNAIDLERIPAARLSITSS